MSRSIYAIVQAGGRQIKVTPGAQVKIDRVDAEVGSTIEFNHVLMVGGGLKVHLGAPDLPGAALDAEVVAHGKAEKVLIFKKHRRKNYRRKRGFRAQYTLVKIGRLHGTGEVWEAISQA